ncbi:MAG: GNAT family N-acetyltransferase [Pseudomonadota bacterium]
MLIEDPAELRRYSDVWEDLVRNAAEPNVFYEPWFVFSALKTLQLEPKPMFLLVFDGAPGGAQEAKLCGLFPLEKRKLRKTLPIPSRGLWRHPYCLLCTPLLRAGRVAETVQTFCAWILESKVGAVFADFQLLSGTGPFACALEEELGRRRLPHISYSRYERALLKNPTDLDAYFKKFFSAKKRKRYRRLARRISEAGKFEELELDRGGNAGRWVEWFLELETRGWKGREGSALLAEPSHAAFFREMSREAFCNGVLMMCGLFLDGQPIAMLCDLRSGTGAFSFKTAFDEKFSKYSPGLLVELFNLRNLQKYPQIRWMDSCASSHNQQINRLWVDRRPLRSVLFSRRRVPYRILFSVLFGLQKMWKLLKRSFRSRTGAEPKD